MPENTAVSVSVTHCSRRFGKTGGAAEGSFFSSLALHQSIFFVGISIGKMSESTTPVLFDRQNVESWHRSFEDYLRKHNLLRLVRGKEKEPALLQPGQGVKEFELRENRVDVRDYAERKRKAFVAVCEAVSKDTILYASRELDELRELAAPDPNAAYRHIMKHLRPSTVGATIRVQNKISSMTMSRSETVPMLIQRLAGYLAELDSRSKNGITEANLITRIVYAIKTRPEVYNDYRGKIEQVEDLEPENLPSYKEFTDALIRKYEQLELEKKTIKEMSPEETNENEIVSLIRGGRGRGGGRGGRGRGDKRRSGRGFKNRSIPKQTHYQPQPDHYQPQPDQTVSVPTVTCFNCGLQGHLMADCRRKDKKFVSCNICHRTGHYKEQCYHNRMNQNFQTKRQKLTVLNQKICSLFDKESEFIIDSGATCHACFELKSFDEYRSLPVPMEVELANGEKILGIGVGKVGELDNVVHIPTLQMNVVSVSQLDREGHGILFERGIVSIKKLSEAKFKPIGTIRDDLYELSGPEIISSMKQKSWMKSLWHQRLGHANERIVAETINYGAVDGVNTTDPGRK